MTEKSKHQKCTHGSMQHGTLSGIHQFLFGLLQVSFLQQEKWKGFSTELTTPVKSIAQYCDYLSAQSKKSRLQHRSPTPIRSLADSLCVKYIKECTRSSYLPCFDELNKTLEEKQPYVFVFLNNFTPDDSQKSYKFLQSLERSGCNFSIVITTHSSGSNTGNIYQVYLESPSH